MKVFVINLQSSTERRATIEEQLKKTGLDWEIFPAFDGRNLTENEREDIYDEKRAKKITGRILSNGEIGCAMSHRNIYRKMVEDNIKKAVILEDDIILAPDFKKVAEELEILSFRNTVIKLELKKSTSRVSVWNQKKVGLNRKICKNAEKVNHGTYSYYIDIIAATRILALSNRIITVADDWALFGKKSKLCLLMPGIVSIDEKYESDIWKFDITQEFLGTKKKYPKGINFLIRNYNKIDFTFFKQFLP